MKKIYKAIVWTEDPKKAGQRVEVAAENLDDARKELEAKYGEGRVFNLHNEEDAAKPRKPTAVTDN